MREKIMEETKRVFKPEFLNRIDDIIVFKTLSKEMLTRIVELEVSKVLARIKDKGITVALDASASELLIEKGYDPTYGARPMRRAVERYLEDPIAEDILRGSYKSGDQIQATRDGDKMIFKITTTSTRPKVKGEKKKN
jgi:ATP-dependent Clp protease ATP-binding subunit ClpC